MSKNLILLLLVAAIGCDKPIVDFAPGGAEQATPKNAAAFEVAQTQKFLGFPVRDFPEPQGVKKFDELAADAAVLSFSLTPRKVSGPEPRDYYKSRPQVFAKGPDGTEIEAFCGYGNDKAIAPGHGFQSTPENRRHSYGGGAYHPQDVFIGKRVDGLLKPGLFFRDVGSHNTAPHALAVDSKGRCHLMVADVDTGQLNRFKLYWLQGDLATGKWTEAWLVDYRDNFTSWAHPWSAAWKEQIHLIWNWADLTLGDMSKGTGIYHVLWTPAGFDRKVRIFNGEAHNLDMAVDPASGRLVLVFGTEEGVFVASKPAEGSWTRPTRLHTELNKNHTVSVRAVADGAFVIRTHLRNTKEWLLTVGEAPKGTKPSAKQSAHHDRLGDPLPEGAVARLGSLRLTHESYCRHVTISPDGSVLASGTGGGDIVLWDVPSGKEIRMISGHASGINGLAFSHDGKHLASGSSDRTARIWDVLTGQEQFRVKHDDVVNAVAYSADGKTLASASSDGTIRFSDAATGKQVRQLTAKKEKFSALAFAPQGRVLASASWDKPAISLWDLDKEDERRQLTGHKDGTYSLSFSQDGKLLASAGWDGTVLLTDPLKGVEIYRFGDGKIGEPISVTAMALSRDGKLVAAADRDKAIVIWEAATGKRIRSFGPTETVFALAFSPDGEFLAAADRIKSRLWNVSKGEEVCPGQGHRDWLTSVAFSPSGKSIATASNDRTVIVWDRDTSAPVHKLEHEGEVKCAVFSPDGKLLASATRDKTVYFWNATTGRIVMRLEGHDSVDSVAFSPDGKVLATGSKQAIYLWDVATGKETGRLNGHKGWIGSLVFTSNGKELISGSVDGTVRLWNIMTGKETRQFATEEMVDCLALSPDGATVAIGYFQKKAIRIWEPATGKIRRTLEGPNGGTFGVAFSPDGKILAAAGDNEVRLLITATGEEVDRLQGHLERVFCLAISPDGSTLVSGSGDYTALLWDIAGVGKK